MIPNLPTNRREMTAKFLEYVSPNHHVIRFYYLVLLTEKSPEASHSLIPLLLAPCPCPSEEVNFQVTNLLFITSIYYFSPFNLSVLLKVTTLSVYHIHVSSLKQLDIFSFYLPSWLRSCWLCLLTEITKWQTAFLSLREHELLDLSFLSTTTLNQDRGDPAPAM